MKRNFTQKEIYEYLSNNPLGVEVHIGDLEDMQGKDYIFLDYSYDIGINADDDSLTQTILQISICTKDYDNRRTLVKYIKELFATIQPTYSKSDEFEYYMAQFTFGVILYE